MVVMAPITAELIQVLRSTDTIQVYSLHRRCSPAEVASAVSVCINDPNAVVAVHALHIVADMDPPLPSSAIPTIAPNLISALAHSNPAVAAAALRTVEILAVTSAEVVTDALEVCGLRNFDDAVRSEAIAALVHLYVQGIIRSTTFFSEIRRLAQNDSNAIVSQTASASLITLEGHVSQPVFGFIPNSMFDQLRCSLSKPTRAGLVGDIASLLRTVSDASVIAVPGFINFLVFDLIRDPACAPLALQMLGDIILHRPSLECDVSLLGVPSFVGVAGLVGPSRPIHADIVMKLIEWSAGAVLPAITSCLLRGVVHETFLTYCTYLVLTLLSATIPAPDHHVRPLTLALLHALDHALQPPKLIVELLTLISASYPGTLPGDLPSVVQARIPHGQLPTLNPNAAGLDRVHFPFLRVFPRRRPRSRPIHSALPVKETVAVKNDISSQLPSSNSGDFVAKQPLWNNDPTHIASKLRSLKAKGRRALSAQVQRSPSQEAFSETFPAAVCGSDGNSGKTAILSQTLSDVWKPPRRLSHRASASGRRMEGVECRDKYLDTSEVMALIHCADIDGECVKVISDMQSTSWEMQFSALGTLRRLAVHHSQDLAPHIHRTTLLTSILAALSSLRSSLVRTALLTITDLLTYCSGTMNDRSLLIALIPDLLRRATDANEFLAVEAQKALESMSQLRHSLLALLEVRGRTHGEKAKIGQCLASCVNRRGCTQALYERTLKLACSFLEEGASDVRLGAKQLLFALVARSSTSVLLDAATSVLTTRQTDLVRGVLAKEPSMIAPSIHSTRYRHHGPASVTPPRGHASDDDVDVPVLSSSDPIEAVSGFTFGAMVEADLASVEWRRRLHGLENVLDSIRNDPTILSDGDVLQILQRVAPRLSDVNSKINFCALETLSAVLAASSWLLPAAALNDLLPPLGACLASSHANIRASASSVMDMIMQRSHGPELLMQLGRLASFGNIRVKCAAVTKLAALVELVTSKSAIRKYGFPLAIAMLDERKGDVHRANRQLLLALRTALGTHIWEDEVAALSNDKARKLQQELFATTVVS